MRVSCPYAQMLCFRLGLGIKTEHEGVLWEGGFCLPLLFLMRKGIGGNVGDLMLRAVHYGFSQSFNVSARKAYEWCTDYGPGDMALMREENATREVHHISGDVILLNDTYTIEGKTVVKQKLVCLYSNRLTWTSTHLTGPNRYSQYLYEIVPQNGGQCCLNFTGLYLNHTIKEASEEKEAERLAKDLKKMDSENWKLLAKEMEKDLK
jgi:hypothetical protein